MKELKYIIHSRRIYQLRKDLFEEMSLFEKEIQNYIGKGYEPLGGISVCSLEPNQQIIISQSLVKREQVFD